MRPVPIASYFALALFALSLTFGCTVDADEGGADTVGTDTLGAADTAGGADTGTDAADESTAGDVPTGDTTSAADLPEGPDGDVEPNAMPGECFEVFGPDGISHTAPRHHDAGVVTVGDPLQIDVRFYNFCADPNARVEAIEVDADEGLDVTTSGLGAGDTIAVEGTIEVALTPTVPGALQVEVTVRVNHGYYAFSVALEAVSE